MTEEGGGMRELIELMSENKRFHITLIGYTIAVKQKKVNLQFFI